MQGGQQLANKYAQEWSIFDQALRMDPRDPMANLGMAMIEMGADKVSDMEYAIAYRGQMNNPHLAAAEQNGNGDMRQAINNLRVRASYKTGGAMAGYYGNNGSEGALDYHNFVNDFGFTFLDVLARFLQSAGGLMLNWMGSCRQSAGKILGRFN